MIRDQELRMECLKLAVAASPLDPVEAAKRFEEFVTGRAWADVEGRLANAAAALNGDCSAS